MVNKGLLSYRRRYKRRYVQTNGRLKCPWSPFLYCDKHRDCPMESRGFLNMLDAWLLTGRSPRTIDLETSGEGYRGSGLENVIVGKAEIYRLFRDPDSVIHFLTHDRARMHKALCKDLARAIFIWREINKGISWKRADSIFRREAIGNDD